MTTIVNSTPTTRTEDSRALQSHIASTNKGPNKWTAVGGGAFVGMITALAIGLIFGPIAAIICFCVASIASTLHAAFAVKQCKNAVPYQQTADQPSIKDLELRTKLNEIRRIQKDTY